MRFFFNINHCSSQIPDIWGEKLTIHCAEINDLLDTILKIGFSHSQTHSGWDRFYIDQAANKSSAAHLYLHRRHSHTADAGRHRLLLHVTSLPRDFFKDARPFHLPCIYSVCVLVAIAIIISMMRSPLLTHDHSHDLLWLIIMFPTLLIFNKHFLNKKLIWSEALWS